MRPWLRLAFHRSTPNHDVSMRLRAVSLDGRWSRADYLGLPAIGERVMNSAGSWFLLLLLLCILGPYVLGVRPKTRRDWTCIAITIGFIAWALILMAPLRSR